MVTDLKSVCCKAKFRDNHSNLNSFTKSKIQGAVQNYWDIYQMFVFPYMFCSYGCVYEKEIVF